MRFVLLAIFVFTAIILGSNTLNVYATTVSNGYTATTTNGWNGFIWFYKFTGLPVGTNIQSTGIDISSSPQPVRMKIYQDDGTLINTTSTHANQATDTNGWNGNVWAQKFTGLQSGKTIYSV